MVKDEPVCLLLLSFLDSLPNSNGFLDRIKNVTWLIHVAFTHAVRIPLPFLVSTEPYKKRDSAQKTMAATGIEPVTSRFPPCVLVLCLPVFKNAIDQAAIQAALRAPFEQYGHHRGFKRRLSLPLALIASSTSPTYTGFLFRMPKNPNHQRLTLPGSLGYALLTWLAIVPLLCSDALSQSDLYPPVRNHARLLSKKLPTHWKEMVWINITKIALRGYVSVEGDRVKLCYKGNEINTFRLTLALPSCKPEDLRIKPVWNHFVRTVRNSVPQLPKLLLLIRNSAPQLPAELLLLIASHCETIDSLKAGTLVCRSWLQPMSEELYKRGLCRLSWHILRRAEQQGVLNQWLCNVANFQHLSVDLPLCRYYQLIQDTSFTRITYLELSGSMMLSEHILLTRKASEVVRFENLSHLVLRNLCGQLEAWIGLLQGVDPRKLKTLTCSHCIVLGEPFSPSDFADAAPGHLEFDNLALSLSYCWGMIDIFQHFSVTGISSLSITQHLLEGAIVNFLNRQASSLKLLAWHASIIDAIQINFGVMHKLECLSILGTTIQPSVPLPIRLKVISEIACTSHLHELCLSMETSNATKCQALDDALLELLEQRPLSRTMIAASHFYDAVDTDTAALGQFVPRTWNVVGDGLSFCKASDIQWTSLLCNHQSMQLSMKNGIKSL
ncbi:hypothetical protein D9758_014614 [Tetrapyrgos nigripes]|uniref:F-box domain-containing protein n=1 Tax=Tetrapyrgos nigripes TaxID=182062 RepID=A0A8H5FUF5_9AGAR|nr:hypothetical protein D9758_014614 [Tetrapyrgos nigripes]